MDRRATGQPERYVAVAEVARPHGIAGELRLRVYNPDSDLLAGRPRVRLVTEDGRAIEAELRAVRSVPGALLVRLSGVSDRDAAEALRGARVEVARDELEPTEEDEYYHVDLIGCRVELGGEAIGEVVAVVSYPSCDALVIQQRGGGKLEVPLAAPYLERIDVDNQRIELSTLEGID
jgi:16S rRNA processing protein RimM